MVSVDGNPGELCISLCVGVCSCVTGCVNKGVFLCALPSTMSTSLHSVCVCACVCVCVSCVCVCFLGNAR